MKTFGNIKRRATKLLFMPYTLGELAEELETDTSVIQQACNEGCHCSAGEENTWIMGTDFQEWIGVSNTVIHPDKPVLRENWADVKIYLAYNDQVLQLDKQTVKRKRTHLRHFLEWAGSEPFPNSPKITPAFPAYLVNARNDQHSGRLSSETLDAGCEEVRRFLSWASDEIPYRYGKLSKTWIKTIRPGRAYGRQSELKIHEYYSEEEILLLSTMKPRDLTEQRDLAAICFLFLSGMRVDAFVTLPLSCIDLVNNEINQLPAFGVRTKNKKAAKTNLLQIPSLLSIVEEWDKLVRNDLALNMLWYAFLNTGKYLAGREIAGEDRRSFVARGLKQLCERAGIKYKSPHKLRHGFTVYALNNAKDMKEFKAVSQNLMHSSISITDGVYGNLVPAEVKKIIGNLGISPKHKIPNDEMGNLIQALAKLQANPGLLQSILAS
jgi:integrase